jgi:hypothetical protein
MTTDTYAIERLMKQQLDGNFWSFDVEGRIVWNDVAVDFIPQFKRYTWTDGEEDRPKAQMVRRDWSMDDFRRIEKLRIKRRFWSQIAKNFGASDTATSDFYKRVIAQQNENMTKEVTIRRMKIIKWMHDEGINAKAISMFMHYDRGMIESVTGREEE